MTQPPPPWYVLMVILLSSLSVGLANAWYTNHVARRECASLSVELDIYREVPPVTETGRRLAEAKEARYRVNC
jgi:hypothetical protein